MYILILLYIDLFNCSTLLIQIIFTMQHTKKTFFLFQFNKSLKERLPDLLSFMRYLIYPQNYQQYESISKDIFRTISQQLVREKQASKLLGVGEFIMAIILSGHIHLYRIFDKTIFRTLCEIYKQNSKHKNDIQTNQNTCGYSKNKEIVQQSIDQYEVQLAQQIIYLMAQWFPKDFIDTSRYSIYKKNYTSLLFRNNMELVPVIYNIKYLKDVEQKLKLLGIIDMQGCNLCLRIIQPYYSKQLEKRISNNIQRSKEPQQKEVNRNQQLFIKQQKNILRKKPKQSQECNEIKVENHIYSFNQMQTPIVRLRKRIKFKSEMRYETSRKSSESYELSKHTTNNLLTKKQSFSKKSTTKLDNAQKTQKFATNFRTQTPSIQAAKQINQQKSNKILQNKFLNPQALNYHISPHSVNKSENETNFHSMVSSLSIIDELDTIQFKSELGCRPISQKREIFQNIKELSSLKYKIHNGIVKLLYDKAYPIHIHSPPKQNLLKHKISDSYYLIDICRGERIIISYLNKQKQQKILGKENNQITLPIGLIKLMENMPSSQWEMDKSRLIERLFKLDTTICGDISNLAVRLFLQQKKGYKVQKSYQLTVKISHIKFKIALSALKQKILIKAWCPQTTDAQVVIEKLLNEIIFCYGSKQ